MNKPWQVCLVLVAIFAAGGISGGLVAFQIARKHAPPPSGVWFARRIENVARELQLTPAQMEREAQCRGIDQAEPPVDAHGA
jgi:hypothetical protein